MSQTHRVTGRATSVFTDDKGALCCVYHQTVVARKIGDKVELNTGGWRTVTTKTRMNQFANQHCNGKFVVYQSKGDWFVQGRNDPHSFSIPFNGDKVTVTL